MPRPNAVAELRLCGQRSFLAGALANKQTARRTDPAKVSMPWLNATVGIHLCGQCSFLAGALANKQTA